MLFASKFSNTDLVIQAEEVEWVHPNGPHSALQPRVIQPNVMISFRPEVGVSDAARVAAVVHFRGRGSLGALPYAEASTLGNTAYEGYEPKFRFGWIDTENPSMVPPEHRELAERVLTEKSGGANYFLWEPEKLKPPWPSYDKITTKAGVSNADVVKKIVERIREDGYNPIEVIAYERENKNRETVVRGIEELIAEDMHQRAEDASLEVVV